VNLPAQLAFRALREQPLSLGHISSNHYGENELLNRKVVTGEFWTSKQRQASSLHEISYRACFKPQLPRFFIESFTQPDDIIYDPFAGRGTTAIEAALLGRIPISNDINPLSRLLCEPRLRPPSLLEVEKRLATIFSNISEIEPDIDLAMFYHPQTLAEILHLRHYLKSKKESSDYVDDWIRMVATNRLTGHSKNFFSVYTMPPNQAVGAEEQIRINRKRKQSPTYKNVKEIILIKTRSLLSDLTDTDRENLWRVSERAMFLNTDARTTKEIADNSIALTVTSPPFLDVVAYTKDNWLRCWFNNLNTEAIGRNMTMAKTVEIWSEVMFGVMRELFRITKESGTVAFEVGEVRNGKVKLEDAVLEVGLRAGFRCDTVMINQQAFTKTSNIWGVSNNEKGTNTNRITVFTKDSM